MPAGKYRLLRIEIPAFAQPFRTGDRLRITLDAPGGAKPLWAFRTLDHGQRVTVGADRPPPVVVRADDGAGHPRAEEGAAVPLVAVAAVSDVPRLARHGIETER